MFYLLGRQMVHLAVWPLWEIPPSKLCDDEDEESESNASHSERIGKYVKQHHRSRRIYHNILKNIISRRGLHPLDNASGHL